MTRPGISLCMIVKNEVGRLADALASVRGVVDQVLIGDTGSTDGTQALAASLGATVVTVPWSDDFAAARNALLAHADQPWIFYFDADERLTPRGRQWLANDLPMPGDDMFYAVFVSVATRRRFSRPSLFPNGLGIHWVRRLHEWPTWPDGRAVAGLVIPDLAFEHVGDQRPKAGEREKHERYLQIEQGLLAAAPDSQVDRHYLAMSLLALERYEEAYQILLAAWENPSWRAKWKPGTLAWRLAVAARLAGGKSRWRTWAERCLTDVPTFAIAWELLVTGLYKEEGMAACVTAAERWFDLCRSGDSIADVAFASHPDMLAAAWRFHVCARLAVGDTGEAQRWAYRDGAPRDLAVHADLMMGDTESAVHRYCAMMDRPDDALTAWLGWLQAPAPAPDLVPAVLWGSLPGRHYAELAADRFAAVVAAFPESALPRWRRALFCLDAGHDPQLAVTDLRWVTAHDPDNAPAWELLAMAAERCGTMVAEKAVPVR